MNDLQAQTTVNMGTLEDEVATLKTENAELRANMGTLETENSERRAKMGTLEDEVATLKPENAELRANMGTLETENSELRAKMGTLETENAELRARIDALETKIAELMAENAELTKELELFRGGCYNQVDCSICLEKLSLDREECVIPCGHIFHYDCFLDWYSRQPSCPVCRERYEHLYDKGFEGGTWAH
jgi:peptidoglycan hydrolase CwlO-like protein